MENRTLRVFKTTTYREKPNSDELAFGRTFTDHMFVMDYSESEGWHDAKIVPYEPLKVDPAAMVFHYGQSVFEGLKAYLSPKGEPLLFRPRKNIARLNQSNERLCIPPIDEGFLLHALKQLIHIEKDWIPSSEGTSLYVRPVIISTEPFLGVAPSKQYKLVVILSPVGAYYKEGINPIKIAVENEYVRAVRGGTGEAKTGGNYAASLKAQEIAAKDGYSQVLWLDGIEKKYIEEVGSMNVFFKIGDEVVTPQLNGSILNGVTRSSVIEMLEHWGVMVNERKLTIEELYYEYQNGNVQEAFGSGTAAVISPIGQLDWNEHQMVFNGGKTGTLAKKLYDTLTGIQYGQIDDPFNWVEKVLPEEKIDKVG
ncbi:branched-chain amino acid aminotransferase [Piscibacillus halophilus]|uniref:Branched-chain-amino-acid aminotransferase n=1 Tax=Piscibacillus halophilus TaxID=571933 RepID=A0A1H9GQ85_9BACI|nr:branched-chain amino acid aminotransferase [Piscibacillus halophilus]SEQ52149.1 branched-chain amino acid aminotransferase [Piscibacillus halophilus]